MKSIWATCTEYFQTDEARRHFKESVIHPIGEVLYQDIYVYVWLICFYHIFLIVLLLCLVVMILKQQYMVTLLLQKIV